LENQISQFSNTKEAKHLQPTANSYSCLTLSVCFITSPVDTDGPSADDIVADTDEPSADGTAAGTEVASADDIAVNKPPTDNSAVPSYYHLPGNTSLHLLLL
jgi:hypothetical protein